MIEVRHLRLVYHVAREASLTIAARHLNLTQSALSHQLTVLEERLGCQLFLRVGKKLRLTEAGRRVLDTAEAVLPLIADAERDVRRQAKGGGAARVRFSTECYTSYHWLPSLINAYEERGEEIQVELAPAATRRIVEALLEGEIDVGLISHEIDEPLLDVTPLFDDEKVAVVSPQHAWAGRVCVEAADFEDENILVPDRADSGFINTYLRGAGVSPRRVTEVGVTEGIRELAKAGAGVAVLARWVAEPDLAKGDLVALHIGGAGLWRTWRAAYLRGRARPTHFRRFVEALKLTLQPPRSDHAPSACAAATS